MLERETELIKQLIVESTIDGREAIKLNDVLAASLPRGVKAFMTAEVTKRLEADFSQSETLSQISKGIGSTVTAERSVIRSLAMEYLLQRDEYLKLVEDAVHFLENYLCRPRWTLHQLMFEQEQEISFDVLVKKFESVVEYGYFGMVVERYLRRKSLGTIDATQFKSLIANIDAEVVKQHTPRELALLAKPIFDFLLFGDASMARPIPLGAILLFYEDKKLLNVKDYIERICQVRSRTQISMSELIGILEDLYHVETTVKEEVQQSEKEIFNPVGQAIQPEPIAAEPVAAINGDPLRQIAEENPESSVVEEQPTPVTSQATTQVEGPPSLEVSGVNKPDQITHDPPAELSQSSAAGIDELAAYAKERETLRRASLLTFPERPTKEELRAELPDIHDMLTQEQREQFVKKIFKNDENSCFIFLTSLNKAQSWREAQPYLRDLFEMNKLDLLSHDVVEFTDAMQARYHPELKRAE